MKSRSTFLLVAAFAAVFFSTGIPYWRIPYAKLSLPDSLYGPFLTAVLVAPIVVRLFSRASFLKTSAVIGLAVPAMVMARVMVDAFRDSSSHNLWPFEFLIASVVGLGISSAGALAGGLLAKLLRTGPFRDDA